MKTDDILLDIALFEDLGRPFQDITTEMLFATATERMTDTSQERRTDTSAEAFAEGLPRAQCANIVSKDSNNVVICGLKLLQPLFDKFEAPVNFDFHVKDGDTVATGDIIVSIFADPKILLMAERTVLNFLRHLSGIATLTAKFVNAVKDYDIKILDTRKTTPGMRYLEKYAVQCGGGVNHRMGLYDVIMVKDTHVDLLGGMKHVMEKLERVGTLDMPVIIEVRNLAELDCVLHFIDVGVNRVLLDNMSYDDMQEAVKMCEGRVETEASGNITLNNIVDVAKTSVDYASIGCLTSSAGHVDLSMKSIQNLNGKK